MSEVPEKCANYTNRTYLTSPTEEHSDSPPIPTSATSTPGAGTVAWVDRPGFSEAVEAVFAAAEQGNYLVTRGYFDRDDAEEYVAAAYPVIAAAVSEQCRLAVIVHYTEDSYPPPRGKRRDGDLLSEYDAGVADAELAIADIRDAARELTEGATE